MSNSTRTERRIRTVERHVDAIEARFGRRQPRPAPRRQRTRQAIVAAASQEA